MADVSKNLPSPKITLTLAEMFCKTALKFPDNVAVTYIDGYNQEDVTYKELDTSALQISSCLKTFCKLQNTIVGIYSREIPGLLACMIGVLRIPAAFAPIGLDWPVRMAKEFIESSGASVVLVSLDSLEKFKQLLEMLDDSTSTFRLITDFEPLRLNGFAVAVVNQSNTVSLDQSLAYVMQTSGTTGSPTVVKVPHVCIVPNITSLGTIFEMTEKDSTAVVSPYTFDPFIVQVFLALSSGGQAVVVSEAVKLQTEKLCEMLFDVLKISVFQPTPYLLYLIGHERIKRKILGEQSPLRVLAIGGESCPTFSVLRNWKHPKCTTRLFNLYGITEVSSWASCFEISDQDLQDKDKIVSTKKIEVGDIVLDLNDSVPLGCPLEDTIFEVRDDNGSKIDDGVGCIFIGGHNRVCYLGNETSIIPGTLRSTADLGYIKEDKLWFIGRKNRSIKRQGKLISLDWLERSLSKAFPDVLFCFVADTSSDSPQNQIYLFAKPDTSYDERQLRESLKRELRESFPPYTYPDYIGIVSMIPLTSHGKVDTRALLKACHKELLRPGESVVEILENIWLNGIKRMEDDPNVELALTRSVDGTEKDQVSPYGATKDLLTHVKSEDMFVEHGGSSLAALRVANEIKAWFQQEVPVPSQEQELLELVDVILNSSFGKLCEYIKTRIPSKTYHSDVTICQDMVEISGPSQGDIDFGSVDEKENSPAEFSTISKCKIFSKPSKNNQVFDQLTSILTKKRKVEDAKHTLQIEAATDMSGCYCSIQRGMRATKCPSCTTSTMGSSQVVHHTRDASKSNISVKWKTSLHKCIDASPLVVGANDKDMAVVYLGSHAHVFKAVYLSTGQVLCETRLGDRIESSAALSRCGLYVVVGCYDGKVYVLNRHNGKLIWAYQTGGPVKSSPCVDPSTGIVWIGSHDHYLYALDVDQRKCISSFDCGSSCFSSPWVLDTLHLVFIGTFGGRLFCVNTSSQSVQWSKQCPQPIFSSPLATSKAVVYTCVDGIVYCCDLEGQPLWEFKTAEPVFSSPSMFVRGYEAYILFGSHDGFVYCLSESGEMRWKFETDSQVYSTPFVAPGFRHELDNSHLEIPGSTMLPKKPDTTSLSTVRGTGVAYSHDPVVVICSTQGTLYCLSLNGYLFSSMSLPGQVFSSPVLVGNNIVVGCRDDFLYCFTIN